MVTRPTLNYEKGAAAPMTHPATSAATRAAFNEQISASAAAETTHPGESATISTDAEYTIATSSNDNATTLNKRKASFPSFRQV
jgi:hypothetical protein